MRVLPPILEMAREIRAGETTAARVTAECLARIEELEPAVSAWVLVDKAGATRTAELSSHEALAGKLRGPLDGIPIAVKDVFDVEGFPTRAGSSLTSPSCAQRDAAVVARLRAAGAIVLGKTVTTEFACFDPSPTRNPWNLEHTPGGSSSGSAAAVALGMCFGALASQTGGSITRPAAYCGVAGIKPTFGCLSRSGVVPVSFHLDHVGVMARGVADCRLLFDWMLGDDPSDPACVPRPNIEAAGTERDSRPKLGILRDYFFETAEPDVASLTEGAIEKLAAAGAEVLSLEQLPGFDQVHAMHRRIMAAEAATYHRETYAASREKYGPNLTSLLEEGGAISMSDYQSALRAQQAFRHAANRALIQLDALITPATPGPAPRGLSSTGDPRFNSPWSFAGVPTVSFPFTLAASGLPLSLQLVGRSWSEHPLLTAAEWCESVLGFHHAPPPAV
ncbi:MAG TPA: amidase [Pirellulales bacterium]|jgi:Asp-tRNA(Asn)/Glu-tRNA(Gln) amidotransferase A subunit family amidase|nr:amidase [Pirellulales bacterium]